MKIKQYISLLLISYIVPWLYCHYSVYWTWNGGTSYNLNIFEFPVILIFCLILYLNPHKKENWFSIYTFVPATTIIGFYLLYDTAYSYFLKSPRPSDIKQIPLLLLVDPLMFFALVGFIVLLLLPILMVVLVYLFNSKKEQKMKVLVLKILAFILLIIIMSSHTTYSFQQTYLDFSKWSETLNVKNNGRIASFLYYHNRRKDALLNIKHFARINIENYFYNKKPKYKRNIYVIVLESFIDPRNFKGLKFNRSPISNELIPFLLSDSRFSLVKSPVYGAATPQAEFEILSGIPALAIIDPIEFNVFEGTKTSSLVNALKETGYENIASIATQPGYYNSRAAYKGFGFDILYFLDKNSYFKKNPDDQYLFDGDLFNANLAYLQSNLILKDKKRPFLNYMVGMYGHWPYNRRKSARPDIVTTNSNIEKINKISNQFYYRTRSLGIFLKKLRELDEDPIILIISDHLPPIINNKSPYMYDKKTNIALLLDSYRPVDISGKSYYELPHIIWNLLNKTKNPLQTDSIFKNVNARTYYFTFLSEAMGLLSPIKASIKYQ